jgi:putative DNA primase/helicase
MSDAIAILERLKSIVGGDRQNVDRKGIAELTNVPIKARFSVSVNELPRLPDASAALKSRLLVFPFPVPFEGREDFGLRDRLLAEIPGITNWALAGLREFRKAGRLLQPKAGRDTLNDFVRLSSPVKAFLDDCCEVAPNATVASSDLQEAWKAWCQQNGHEPGSHSYFGAKLSAALPGLRRRRQRVEGRQVYLYDGIALQAKVTTELNNRRRGGELLA